MTAPGAGRPPALPEARVPLPVREELGLRRARPLSGGGTPARVYAGETGGGEAVVVKVLHSSAGAVDGHDLASFLRKPAQISRIHRELPGLSPYYVPVLGEWRGPGWGAYAMPWVEGVPPLTLLESVDSRSRQRFLAALRSVFEVLGAHGYQASRVPAPPGRGAATHLDRLARRLPLLTRHLGPVVDEPALRVNGTSVPSARELLRRAAARPDVLAALQPADLYYPVHGDLNLGNLMIQADGAPDSDPDRPHRFTVLDPRGVEEHWDPVYDAAKALFSMTLFDAAMAGGFQIGRRGPHSYTVRLRRPVPVYSATALQLPDALASVAFFRGLGSSDPLWRRRLLYTHAFHVLAESACRLSDHTARTFPGVTGLAARRELAMGLYLSGLLLLDHLLAGPREPEHDCAAHLNHLAAINLPAPATSF